MAMKDRDTIPEIIESPIGLSNNVRGPSGVLAGLFRKMLKGYEVTHTVWSNYMMDYIADPTNGYDRNPKERMTARGNLNKEFAHRKMTWKAFCRALKFLKVDKVSIKLEVERGDTKVKIFSIDMNLK